MEELEYSVEISDRDWDCFFAECEECNLLPPSLAGVDDSGMSDIDDKGSILAKRAQNDDLTAGFSEADGPIDGPPHCEGSPVEHYLSKHAVGGMESVLSGSEEDIHLQSVNIFFERLKNLTEAERLAEPSQLRDGKNSEAVQEKGRCSDGQQASSSSLPKNIPKLNSLPASGETAAGKETTEPVDTISNINTMKKDVPGSKIFPVPAASNLVLKTNTPAYPETRLFIREETCTETRVQLNQSHDAPEGAVCSETTPCTNKVIKVEMSKPLDDAKQEDSLKGQSTPGKKCSTDSSSNQEVVTHVKRKEEQIPDAVQSEATCTNKTASQESSPSASIKRKRRKKRRLSVEPAESVHGYERQVLVKHSESEEERCDGRGGTNLCLSQDINLSCLKEPQKHLMSSLTAYSLTSNLPVKISAQEIRVTDLSYYSQYQHLPENIIKNIQTNDRSVIPLGLTDDRVLMSAPNNSGNLSTDLQPTNDIKLHVEESADWPVLNTESVTGIIDLVMGKESSGGMVPNTGSLQQCNTENHSVTYCKNEQNAEFPTAEVKSVDILPSAESNDPAVEVSQPDKLSAAKSVLAVEAGNSGTDNHTVCQTEAEPRQQLEINCGDTDRYRSTLEKTHFPLPARSSDVHITQPEQFNARSLEEISGQAGCAKLALDTNNAWPDKHCPSCSDINVTAQRTEQPPVLHTSKPKFDVLSENNTTNERTELTLSEIMPLQSGNPFLAGEIDLKGQSLRENKSPMSEELLTSPSDITSASSRCTLDTESIMSLSNENITDIVESSYLSVTGKDPGDQGEKTSILLAKHVKGDDGSDFKGQSGSNDTRDSKCDLVVRAGEITALSEAEHEPNSKPSVFAMSSFWSEMEKLTINDILGLRMISTAAPPSSLPPLLESEEADMLAMTDSGIFTQLDESKPEHTDEDTGSDPTSAESSSCSVTAVDSASSRDVMWESLGADIYPDNMMLTSVRDISQPVLPVGAQPCLKKISKNVSVHNLPALESFSYIRKGQTLQTLDEIELQKVDYFTEGHVSKQDNDVDSSLSKDSYRISLTDIFQYLLGTKQTVPSQSATDNINTFYTEGNSVPETYHHFFSEFDTESFFYPLIAAGDKTKEEMVPIFSCSRSANRNLQFPEAYDHFFASSSSDDSSAESDEEDSRGPVRVVTRFTRTSSSSQLSEDIYENFFTDGDLKQNFFWKNTFSFRNISLIGSVEQKQAPSNLISSGLDRQSGRSFGRTVYPLNALGNQDVMFPDPLLCSLKDRIDTQVVQQPFRYEDLQTVVSNPRLDASFLPLRQSDMCLVCIAFASWVLKTANPQVGDTWKAVLLANVSALSAIRYLRKYVKKEAAVGVKKLDYAAPSDS